MITLFMIITIIMLIGLGGGAYYHRLRMDAMCERMDAMSNRIGLLNERIEYKEDEMKRGILLIQQVAELLEGGTYNDQDHSKSEG
jgi:hypothetical protein